MRIFLLPLTTRQALIYCQKPVQQATKTSSYADRITNYAAKTWAQWETHDKGWRKTVITYGNKGLKRIPYQEWGLKSFPPGTPNAEAATLTEGKRYDVLYPGNVVHEKDVPKVLYRLARERKTLHWNRFIGSMFAMPFTAPFALIPVYVQDSMVWTRPLMLAEYQIFPSFSLHIDVGVIGEVRQPHAIA